MDSSSTHRRINGFGNWTKKKKIVASHLDHDFNTLCMVNGVEPAPVPKSSKLLLFCWHFRLHNDNKQPPKDEIRQNQVLHAGGSLLIFRANFKFRFNHPILRFELFHMSLIQRSTLI